MEVIDMVRRIFTCLFLLVFVSVSCTAVLAEGIMGEALEEPGTDSFLSQPFEKRFGEDAIVEMDENQNPVSVNGYPFRKVTASFNVRGLEDKFSAETDFVDYPFWQPATKYNGSLANMSLIMALCAARDKPHGKALETFDPSQNVEAYLLEAGFSDIRKDDYSKETSIYTISTAIGARRMEHGGEEPFTLIAVGVCGAGYKNEWQSNISAGTSALHEGFRSASDLVIDRIAGYIATRGITGRIKLWISGFSRAAAIANLTAARMTQSGFLLKEDVYAYTFATPAAVLNPPETGNENIFNILCPMDVVPQVMPVGWGYGRYGTDLYIPVQEFSSIGEAAALQREFVIKNTFGIDVHYSASLNFRMRMLFSMVLEMIGTHDNYAENIQQTAVSIMQKIDTSHLLATMRNVLLSMKNSSSESRAGLDRLLNFIFRVFGNAVTRTELAAVNRNSGSSLFLLFTEHREDSYLANMDIIQSGIFEKSQDFVYVMARGPVDLTVTVDELPGWSMTLTDKGTVLENDLTTGRVVENPQFQEYYMERHGNVSIIAVPKDLSVQVVWKAAAAGTLEIRQANVSARASIDYPGASTGEMKVRAGDTGSAWLPAQRNGTLPEGFHEKIWHASDLTEFFGISVPFVSWRVYAAVLLLTIGLFLFLIIRLFSLFLPNLEKKGSGVWLLLAMFCIASVEAEGSFWLLADQPIIRFLWKSVVGITVLAVFFIRHKKRGPLLSSVFPGLAFAIAADLLMTFAFIPGVALFLLGHILLTICFLKKKPMSRAQWIQWAILSLIVACLILLAFASQLGMKAWAVAVYAPVLLLMVYSVSWQTPRIRYAAGFFLVSDFLLGAFLVGVWPDPLAHILCMALFSISLMLFALGERGFASR